MGRLWQTVLLRSNYPVLFKSVIGKQLFSRKDYMTHYKDLSSATANRDLKDATEKGLLIKQGEGRTTLYQFAEKRLDTFNPDRILLYPFGYT